jgi:hypothetical protein
MRAKFYSATVDHAEFEDYRLHRLRAGRRSFYAVIGISLVVGFAVSSLWSFIGGAALAVLLMFVGSGMQGAREKARWIRRFPELAHPSITWHRPS